MSDFKGAENAFGDAVQFEPEVSNFYVRLSHVYAAHNEFYRAVDMMIKTISLKPLRPEYHVRVGGWLFENGQLKEAAEAMRKTIEISPNAVVAPKRLEVVLSIG
ncbi:tetratricopeptide repeat protein [Halomonas sp. AOP22-C1-8]|uniref:tetratricopeptide repeat protein n=1 Tax=Halomonas sp. AOP22-C1-8 TaxID=3457717 RepID=UPI004033D1B2